MTRIPPSGDRAAAPALARIVDQALTGTLDRSPVEATYLGDHARDGLLDDPSADAATARAGEIRSLLAELAALQAEHTDAGAHGSAVVDPDHRVDAAVLRTVLAAELLEIDEIGEAEWNPMLHNPGGGIHALVSRDFAPLPERLVSLEQRLAATPAYLDAARQRLANMSAPHLDTALLQLDGTLALIDTAIDTAREQGAGWDGLTTAATQAKQALSEHQQWLRGRTESATRDPRLGADLFRAKLVLTLDTAFEPEALLARAEADLDRIGQQIIEQAGRVAQVGRPDADTVRTVLADLAKAAPTDATILGMCRDAFDEATEFVRERDLVTVHDDDVVVVAMPEIDRGVAVAYCRPNGPLEERPIPTEFAVSPTPTDWTAERVASFYREYNAHMVQNLTVHEAMPGHALQLMHANRHHASTPVRAVWWSGSFVEGWAVFSEELMAEHGYRSTTSPELCAALRMQQLKMQLRTTINAILDIRFHCDGLSETGALELMQRRGYQEDGEAIGKWRRVQLSSTQLCTYYVGYTEVRAVADDLRIAHPDWSDRKVHDAMLAHGSPPARHLRTLLGLAAADV